jgi:hypothetical protein
VLGAPTATASPRIGAIVHIRRHAAVPAAVPRRPRSSRAGSFLALARSIPSRGRPSETQVASAHRPSAASTFRAHLVCRELRGSARSGGGVQKAYRSGKETGTFLRTSLVRRESGDSSPLVSTSLSAVRARPRPLVSARRGQGRPPHRRSRTTLR